jgi:hypothetical protein
MIILLLFSLVCGLFYLIWILIKSRDTYIKKMKVSIARHTYVEVHSEGKSSAKSANNTELVDKYIL